MALALIALAISAKHLNEPPAYIHAWSQADNYSLALGFLKGGDLLHPQTLIFNKQQNDNEIPLTTTTACDLPLHHYIVSLLMRLTGSTQPWVFRGWTLTVVIVGLWLLYVLAWVLTHSRLWALLVTAVCATAPSFAYYSTAFLPTVPALVCAIAGLTAYVLHLRFEPQGGKWLWVALAMLTLSMLQRTSLAVLWIAVACFHFLRLLRKETSWRRTWLPFATGAVVFVAYYLWNSHLRNENGSLFLASILPAHNSEHALDILQDVHDRWRFHYFQRSQHWLAVLLIVAVVVLEIMRRNPKHEGPISLWWLVAIWFFGELLFVVAMSAQFRDHDYYFLDSLFLPIVFSMALLTAELPALKGRAVQMAGGTAVVALVVLMTFQAIRMQDVRRQEGVEALNTAVAYKSANRLLAQAGVDDNAHLLALFAYPQTTPFCMMNREGYVVMWTNPEVVAHALTFPYDYIIIEDNSFRECFNEAPVLSRLQRLAGNGLLSLCLLSDSTLNPTPDIFFQRGTNYGIDQ